MFSLFSLLLGIVIGVILAAAVPGVYRWGQRKWAKRDELRLPAFLLALPLLLALQLASPTLFAQTTCAADADCISFIYATKYTNDAAISTADIDGAEIEYKTGTGAWQALTKVTYPTAAYTRQPVAPGTNTYRIRQVMRNGAVSAFIESNAVVTLPPPAPPTTLRVVDAKAFKPNLGYMDQLKVTQVGYVPIGTQCSAFTFGSYNLVPLGKRTTINGIRTSPLLKNEAGQLVSVPMQVLAVCKAS